MIFIALGSNLPGRFKRPEENLTHALSAMGQRGMSVAGRSRIWLTPPVPVSDQPDYRNAVVSLETALGPELLLKALLEVEREFGRVRGDERNAARTLDLDILAYRETVVASDHLDIPHPRLAERAFVLLPLNDIAPLWRHPVSGKSAAEMLKALSIPSGCRPLGDEAV